MSGNRYLLDTNAIIALLQKDSNLIQLLQDAEWSGISIITISLKVGRLLVELLTRKLFTNRIKGDRQLGYSTKK